MGKSLVIVESPAKAKTIEKYLGPSFRVTASMGHLRDLPKSSLGVDIEGGFVPDYRPIANREETIEKLRSEAAEANRIYLATDPDREGEAISWHLMELLHLPPERTVRVTSTRSPKKWCWKASGSPAASTWDWWTPRPAAFWTGSWATS